MYVSYTTNNQPTLFTSEVTIMSNRFP